MLNFEQYTLFTWAWIALGIAVFIILNFITAPYGRHTKTTWGPLIDNKLGWFIMEFFLLVVLFYFILTGINEQSIVNIIITGLITIHYLDRSIIYPIRIQTKGKKMPLLIMIFALGFNLSNGFLFGYYLGNFKVYTLNWLTTPQFIIGTLIFITGAVINKYADTDRKSTRLNSSHVRISYAVFCLKKKINKARKAMLECMEKHWINSSIYMMLFSKCSGPAHLCAKHHYVALGFFDMLQIILILLLF